jgi:hypothetical protein
MNLLRFLAGAALLTLGRKLFWLFVAAVGFIWAMNLSAIYLQGQPEWLVIGLALLAGVIGAVIAVSVRWLGVGLGGFLAGAQIAGGLLALLGFEAGGLPWLVWLIGGILGAILFVALFDWALIVLSSISGALILSDLMPFALGSTLAVFLVLVLVGIVVQARLLGEE